MTRGYPDYSPGAARSEEGKFLPTIAKSPVWLEDNFESPVNKWIITEGAAIIESESSGGSFDVGPYSGSGALKMTAGLGDEGNVQRYIGAIPLTLRVGISYFFRLVDGDDFLDAANSITLVYMDIRTGVYAHIFGIRFNYADGKWYYYDGTTPSYIHLFTRKIADNFYHFIKLIIDPITHKYISLQIDSYIYDMSALSFYYAASAVTMRSIFSVTINSAVAVNAEYYIDNFKITYGES